MKDSLCLLLTASILGGCSTFVTYAPRGGGSEQMVKYTQGVGTVSVKDSEHEIYIYPTFKRQGTSEPTFTIGYANNSSEPVQFSRDNIKAYFRGQEVSLYSYSEKIDKIQSDKRGKQVALAILGGLAAGAVAYSASHQTYQSNYGGVIRSRVGYTSFSGHNTIRVYDPMSGLIAGSAFAGVTGLGVQQLEFNAQNEEQVAESILQANTVDPQRAVTGELVLKDCCDRYPKANDVVRFEVNANARTSVFEFQRVSPGEAVSSETLQASTVLPAEVVTKRESEPRQEAMRATPVAPPAPATPVVAVGFTAAVSSSTISSSSNPVSVASAPVLPAIAIATTAAAPQLAVTAMPPKVQGGQDGFNAQRLAKDRSCSPTPTAILVGKGPGFESYSVACANGDALAIRCEFGNCRVLQ